MSYDIQQVYSFILSNICTFFFMIFPHGILREAFPIFWLKLFIFPHSAFKILLAIF
jgi:hypothetical protein